MSHKIVPIKTYILIFMALMVGTALTVGVAYINLGELNTVVALAIAVTKMLLVILFFMHVAQSSQLTKITVFAAFLWLIILIGISTSDYLTRAWIPDPASWGQSTAAIPSAPPETPEPAAPPAPAVP